MNAWLIATFQERRGIPAGEPIGYVGRCDIRPVAPLDVSGYPFTSTSFGDVTIFHGYGEAARDVARAAAIAVEGSEHERGRD